MYRITTDIEKNRLYLTLVGFISEQEALSIKKSLITEISRLSENFDIINDITHFRLGLEQSGEVLKEIIKHLMDCKVNRIVRVVGGSQAGMIQFASNTGSNLPYHVSYVPAVEDAENMLNNTKETVKTVL